MVTATRGEERSLLALPRVGTAVTPDQIRDKSPRTPAEALENESGVFIQRTGHRGGSPIIRGSIGKFVLPMADGVRLQGGDSFSGPNGILNSVDPNMIDRVEVLEGPGSMLYGSDALGGVVQVFTKRNTSFPDKFEIGSSTLARYGTVDGESTGHVEVFGGKAPWNFLFGYTKQQVGDSKGGDGMGRLQNTSWNDEDFSGQINLRPSPGNLWSFRYASVMHTDVRRFDKPWEAPTMDNRWWTDHRALAFTSAGLRTNAWINPFIQTEIATVEYKGENPTSFWDSLSIQANYRHESQDQIQRSEPNTTTTRDDWSDVNKEYWSFSPRFVSKVGDRHRLTYGLDYRFENIPSGNKVRYTYTKATDTYGAGVPQTPSAPDATYQDVGLYLQDEAKVGDRWTFLYGGRYTQEQMVSRPTFATTPAGISTEDLTVDRSWESWTWSAGADYAATPHLHFSGNVATAFRAPSTGDLLGTGAFTAGVASPSPGLSPESSITYEGAAKYEDDRLQSKLCYSWTDYTNLIVQVPGSFNGSNFSDLNGNGTQDAGEQIYIKTNASSAFIYTIDGSISYKAWRGLSLMGTSATISPFLHGGYALGKNTTDDLYLDFVPPLHADYGLRMETDENEKTSRRAFVELMAHSVQRQDRINIGGGQTDSQMLFRGPLSTKLPGYTTFNVSTGYSWDDRWDLTLAVHNLTNKYYQEVFSRLPADGIDFVLSAGMKF